MPARLLPRHAWVTLVTRESYLPGAVLLAYSLHRSQSRYPLIVLTTPSFPQRLIAALEDECRLTHAVHFPIAPLAPPRHLTPSSLIADRFADTWAKLRVFELYRYGCERLVFLDADMLVRRNMDDLLDASSLLPRDWIAANHACVCNLDRDSWAPSSWVRENCAYTGLTADSPPRPVPARGEGKTTHTLLNSGLFLFSPSAEQWAEMRHFLDNDGRLKHYQFPDQDFLADFFEGRWRSLGWEVNALKTMRYWHANIWVDQQVRNVHYIVDKPWNQRIGSDGRAGYLGKDGPTHRWWWEEFGRWKEEREGTGRYLILESMRSAMPSMMGM